MPKSSRVFAIVPAAGRSRRMGKPKLLLPWKGRRIIDCVLDAWTTSCVDHVIVVCRKDDSALKKACEDWSVMVRFPDTDPTDMKASIQHGLTTIANELQPTDSDRWMIAPADIPQLSHRVIDCLLAAQTNKTSEVVVPMFGDHPSHPVLLPWKLAAHVASLGEHEGLKDLIEKQDRRFVEFTTEQYMPDVDTPDEYHRAIQDHDSPSD